MNAQLLRSVGGLLEWFVAAALWLPLPSWPREVPPTLTIVEGPSTIYAASGGAFLPAKGVQLHTCDVLRTGPQAMVQIEYPDGGKIEIGPDSRFVFDLPTAAADAIGPHFLLSGWAKLTVPKGGKAPPLRIDTAQLNLLSKGGVTVLRAGADEAEFFVEQGQALALTDAPSASQKPVTAGCTYARKAGSRGAVSEGVKPAFVKAMPGAFRDTLPSLLPQLKTVNVQPRPASNVRAGEAEEWLRSVADLRSCLADATVRAAQLALERLGIEVGPVDGVLGPLTAAALRQFQQQRGLLRTGRLDASTLKALNVDDGG